MNFLIVGPGAMGCLFASRLCIAGYGVTLLDYKRERAEKISRQGIIVEGVTGEYTANVPVAVGETGSQPDYVLICVKAIKTREAGEEIAPWLPEKSIIATLQNGIGNMETLTEIFEKERVVGGITSEGATVLGWGRIRHAGRGPTVFGPEDSRGARLANLVSAFNKAGFKAESTADVEGLIWGKLIINAGINALTAITRLKNGRLPDLESARVVIKEAVREAAAVAEAKKITLPYPNPFRRALDVCRDTAGNTSSMLQDVLNKKATEVDYINGAIVREGDALGISTPTNRVLTSAVRAIQESYKNYSERHK
jgi:2-dehydropantoate 2-reductase